MVFFHYLSKCLKTCLQVSIIIRVRIRIEGYDDYDVYGMFSYRKDSKTSHKFFFVIVIGGKLRIKGIVL